MWFFAGFMSSLVSLAKAASILQSKQSKKRVMEVSFIISSHYWHAITSSVFNWSHRLILVQCRGNSRWLWESGEGIIGSILGYWLPQYLFIYIYSLIHPGDYQISLMTLYQTFFGGVFRQAVISSKRPSLICLFFCRKIEIWLRHIHHLIAGKIFKYICKGR